MQTRYGDDECGTKSRNASYFPLGSAFGQPGRFIRDAEVLHAIRRYPRSCRQSRTEQDAGESRLCSPGLIDETNEGHGCCVELVWTIRVCRVCLLIEYCYTHKLGLTFVQQRGYHQPTSSRGGGVLLVSVQLCANSRCGVNSFVGLNWWLTSFFFIKSRCECE